MTELVGLVDDLALFRVADDGLVLNVKTLDLTDPVPFSDLSPERYSELPEDMEIPSHWIELVNAACCNLDVTATTAGGQRVYAVPKAVQNEARRALDWSSRATGISEIALGTAKKLASGRPVTLETIRHCSRYFPANAGLVDRNEGWSAFSKGFPSKDRVTYSAWGGDAGKRWSRRIVSSHDDAVFAVSAAGDLPDPTIEGADPTAPHRFVDDGSEYHLCLLCDAAPDDPIHQADSQSDELAPLEVPDDVDPSAVSPDDPHVFRDEDNDGYCDTCQQREGASIHISMGSAMLAATPTLEDADSVLEDFYSDFILPEESAGDEDDAEVEQNLENDPTYMVKVDDPQMPERSKAEQMFVVMPDGQVLEWSYGMWQPADMPDDEPMVELDDDTAEEIGLAFYQKPDEPVALQSVNPGEAAMVAMAVGHIDWSLIDRVTALVAVGEGINPNDGVYTPEERAKNATNQVRDKNGRFAKYGSSVRLPSGATGYITRVDPDTQSVEVETPDGQRATIKADQVEVSDAAQGEPAMPLYTKPDYSGVQGKPRATQGTPVAWLPTLLPVMGAEELQKWVDAWITGVDATRSRGGTRTASLIAAGETPMTPETTDVKPLYLAIVDALDKQAVTDLICLVPASATSSQPIAYRRTPNKWEPAADMLASLRSVNPPPVVSLDDPTLALVMQQVDGGPVPTQNPNPAPVASSAQGPLLYGPNGEILPMALAADGGADRNRGDAEKLRHYWTVGKGGAKIRWNTPGDWKRCVQHLGKYLGPRAKGYCALRHHEMDGVWPGDARNPGGNGRGGPHFATEDEQARKVFVPRATYPFPSLDDLLTASAMVAAGAVEIGGIAPPENADAVPQEGVGFRIPLVIPEDMESGDGRKFAPNSLTTRDMPIPLMWQIQGDEGHSGAVIVGRVDKVDRIPGGLGNALGVMDTGPYALEATRLIKEGMLRGISADLDQFEAETSNPKEEEAAREAAEDGGPIEIKVDKSIGGDKMVITAARLMGITLVAKPAFQECTIQLDGMPSAGVEDAMVPDGIYVEQPHGTEAEPVLASALIAASVPVTPPKSWFDEPTLAGPTAIQVTDEGRVFGHIAAWDVDHIGLPFGTRPPRSRSGYSYFHTGALRTEEGDDVTVGQLTLAGGHASLNATAAEAVKHYDDTASAIADVHAGEDAYGIWVAGALRPGVTPEQVRALRASAPSGDWRPVKGALELVAVCQVNVPGFPITRARVASGTIMALVAAGAGALALQRMHDPTQAIIDRLDRIERPALEAQAVAARERVAERMEVHHQALVASATALRERMAPALEQRRADKAALVAAAEAQRARVAALVFKKPFEERSHPRDTTGRFKDVLFRLQAEQDAEAAGEGGSTPLDPVKAEAIAKLQDADAAEAENRTEDANKSAQDAINLLDRAATDAIDPTSVKTLRQASSDISTAIAHLPLAFDNQAEKMRFSDVPEAGKSMLQSLIDRAEQDGGAMAQEAVDIAKNWMSGGDYISQSEFDAMVSRLVRSLLHANVEDTPM